MMNHISTLQVRGIIPVLASKGVKAFYVGYNEGSMNVVPIPGTVLFPL
jgi:hypothetical protein